MNVGDKFKHDNNRDVFTVLRIKSNGRVEVQYKDRATNETRSGWTNTNWLQETCTQVYDNDYDKQKRKLKI